VTFAPIVLPVRRRNWAIERFAFVTIGFWPVIVVRSPSAASSAFALVSASPRPMLTTIW
jgi:nitrate reductase NapE component